ncbi:MAG: CusA/CzcA family heavy metal efflux RND transporter [Candidatus Binatia bacterium]|nr:CusA/CzcA family heavy metal efflux RND transporter [Candidatus Binatia bacterium]
MFDRIVDLSLRNRSAVLFFTGVVILFGWRAFRALTIEAFPDPTDTQVNVITLFPGQPAEEVERQISLPIERALNGTPGLIRLRSISLFGLSYVTLTFDDGFDVLFARAQTLERLRGAELPEGVVPELGALATPIGEVYRYTLVGAGGDPMRLRTIQDWVVRPRLLRVPGVADVVSYGGLVREVHVQPIPARLAGYDLTLEQLESALRKSSVNASGGVLEHGSEQFVIRSEGMFRSLQDIAAVHVASRDGTPVRVGDVAAVQDGWTPRQGVVSRGNDYDVVQGIVLMRRGENPSVVLQRVRQAVAELNGGGLPTGVSLIPFYDRTDLVNTTLRTVGHNLLEGATLVTIVLFAFLLDIRAAAIAASVIPLSLLSAFIYLHVRGMSANLLSMGAIDFGIIVDGAVVIIESILLHLYGSAHNQSAPYAQALSQRVRAGVTAVVRPTVFALLIIIAAYLPIFLLERVEGRIFAPMSNTVVAALLGALLFSITLVPVLATFAYRHLPVHRESPLLRWAERAYQPALNFALTWPRALLAVVVLALGCSVYLLARMGSEFLPELNEGSLYLTFTLPPDTSLTEGRRMVPQITALLRDHPEVKEVLTQLGRPEDGTDPKLANNLEVFLLLKPPEQWRAHVRNLSDLIEDIRGRLVEVPGVEVNFSQPIRDNVNESISGQKGQVALKLFGEDLVELQQLAEQVKGVLAGVPGIADLGLVLSSEIPQIKVEPDRDALGRYGLDMEDFQHVLQAALGGQQVGVYWDGEARFDIVLRYPPSARAHIEKIRNLQVPVQGGATVPLEMLATVTVGRGRAAITRENGRRYIGIRMNVGGRDLGSFVAEAQQRVAAAVKLPPGVTAEWGGEFESKERAMARLLTVVPVALVVTLILLFQSFQRFGPAMLVLLNTPFALVGGVLALWVAGMPLSVSAAVGFIALIGQASLNGVLVLSRVEEKRREGTPLEMAIVSGCMERLRPVLMTACLAALGLVPAALSHSIGSEVQRPVAVVIVGGTVSACLLTLVVLPALYRLSAPLLGEVRL